MTDELRVVAARIESPYPPVASSQLVAQRHQLGDAGIAVSPSRRELDSLCSSGQADGSS
ncbi:MAG: hypothetical protein ACYCU7_06145 [Acidimicrobiales bacterium]